MQIACAFGAFLALCGLAGVPQGKPRAGPVLSVALTGEQNGYLAPCGCSKPMLGGLPRRAGYLASRPRGEALVRLENGDLTEARGRQDELKAETLLDMLSALNYDAVNLGEKDLRLGLPYLSALQRRFKGALLCANVRKKDGSAAFRESVLLQRVSGGKPVRVLVVGMIARDLAAQALMETPELRPELPIERLRRLLAASDARADIFILLFHGGKAEAHELARHYPQFALVICGHEGDQPGSSEKEGPVMLAVPGQDGKTQGVARLVSEGGWKVAEVKYVPLGPEWKEDPGILRIKETYLDRVNGEELLARMQRAPTPDGGTYAGSATCRSCHGKEHAVWEQSRHAHALTTLAKEKEDRDPECVPCHVVGGDRQGGFLRADSTPHLQHVGCESCHGPGAAHVQDPKSRLSGSALSACLACHIPQHSPKFEFEKYWQKIRH